ncbi:MAG: thioredoxin [Erysipelotrichaceae bacterium]
MSEIKLNAINFEYEVMKSDKPVLVDFYADWCGPCRMLGPVIEEIANQRNDIKVCKLNVDENPELAQAFRVMSIPTLMIVNNGKIAKTSSGFRPKEEIERMLQEAI